MEPVIKPLAQLLLKKWQGLSKEYGKEIFKKNDTAHLVAMSAMQLLIDNPNALQDWFKDKKQAFNTLPDIW